MLVFFVNKNEADTKDSSVSVEKILFMSNESAVSVEYQKIIGKYCRILNFKKKTEYKKSLPGCLKTPEAEILVLGYQINMQFY